MKTKKPAKSIIDNELLIKLNASRTVCTIIINSRMIKIDEIKKTILDIDGRRKILNSKQGME